MHKLFRLLGQQMGIQQVRGILPESIDGFINDAIRDKVHSILLENAVLASQNGVVHERNQITAINALRTLYKEHTDTASSSGTISVGIGNNPYLFLGFSVDYENNGEKYNCRILDPLEVENALHDFCNAPSKRHPIITIRKDESNNSITYALYCGKNNNPNKLTIKYINTPAKVHYATSTSPYTGNVDCDLPEYLHSEVVNLAIQKFYSSVGYTTPSSREQTKE